MAMIGLAPTFLAATTADRPTPPTPNMETLWPALTLAVLITAPAPVITAQPMIDVTSFLIAGSTFTTNCWSAIVWSAHVKTFCATAVPSDTESEIGSGGMDDSSTFLGTQVTMTVSPSHT